MGSAPLVNKDFAVVSQKRVEDRKFFGNVSDVLTNAIMEIITDKQLTNGFRTGTLP